MMISSLEPLLRFVRDTDSADHPSIAAVDQCAGDPDRLFEVAFSCLAIAKGSDSRSTDPTAKQCMTTAFVALSELLDLGGEVGR